ncbi:MAG: hypothetical protein U0166_15870 [Acidobacteriota bacterium]
MKAREALLLFIVPLGAYTLLSGYGIDRGYPTALYGLTRAIVEDHSLSLDRQKELLGYDKAIYKGRLFSDKAPGPALVMIPAYLAARAITPDADLCFTITLLFGMMLPSATAPLAVRLLVARTGSPHGAIGGWCFAFATLFFPYATVGISDPLAATAIAWAWALGIGTGDLALYASGACAGLAILTRYQAALVIAPLAVYVLATRRLASVRFFVPLALAAIAVLGYNFAAFDHPLTFPTFHWQGKPGAAPTLQMGRPTISRAYEMSFGLRRGLFVYTPLLLLVPVGAIELSRRSPLLAASAIAGLALYFGYLLCNAGFWGGADFGLRFSIPALPLCFLLLLAGKSPLSGRAALVFAIPSACVALLGALSGPYVPFRERNPLRYELDALLEHGPRTILSGVPRSPQPAPRP